MLKFVRFGRTIAVLAGASLALSGCSFARSGSTRQDEAVASRQVGDGALLTTTSAAPGAAETPSPGAPTRREPTASPDSSAGAVGAAAGFTIEVVSTNGTPRPGVPAQVSGPVSATVASDPRGRIRFTGPAGRYEVRIEPGCTADIQVQTAASARIAVPEGEIVDGRLTVEARRRRFPGGPVTWEARTKTAQTERSGRLWRVGTPYLVRFTLLDRCAGAPAPGGVVGELGFPSPFPLEVQVQDAPSDGAARAALLVTCRDAGDEVELVVADPQQPDDRLDLFSRATLDDTAPSCVA